MAITIDTTSVDLHIPEVWSKLVVRERERNLVYANLVDRRYEAEASGKAYDQINTGTISNFDVTSNITLGTGGSLTADTPANDPELDFNIAINTHAYKFFDLETESQIMTETDILSEYSAKAGYAVAWKVDTDLAAFINDFNSTVGVLAEELTDEDILDAVRIMNDSNTPQNDRFFVMSSLEQIAKRKVERYTNMMYKSTVGSVDGAGPGEYADIHGMRWFMTTNTEGNNSAGHANGIWQREALAFVMIDNMRKKSFYNISTDSDQFAVHAIYGALEIRGGAFAGNAGDLGGSGVYAKGL